MAASNPPGNGWMESDIGELSIHWMTIPVAPQSYWTKFIAAAIFISVLNLRI